MFHPLWHIGVLPEGAERLAEIDRQRQEAEARRELIDGEGQNALKVAQYTLEIERQKAQVEDDFANRQFVRQWHLQNSELRTQLTMKIIEEYVSGLSSGLADEQRLAQQLSDITQFTSQSTPQMPDVPQSLPTPNTITDDHSSILDREIDALKKLESAGVITNFKIQLDGDNRIKAFIKKLTINIEAKCPIGYPIIAPKIKIHFSSGHIKVPDSREYWRTGVSKTLAEAIEIVLKQIDLKNI